MARFLIGFFLLVCLVIIGCVPTIKPVQFPAEPNIRVALLTAEERVALTATTPFSIYSGNETKVVKPGAICRVSFNNTITIEGIIWLKSANLPVQIKPEPNGLVSIGGKTYRGYIEVRKDQSGKLNVINILPMEKYLMGVVPCEIGGLNDKNFEAGKAQAIAARSYALSHFNWFDDLGFDVYASYLRDQEYRGHIAETEMTNKAVLATSGVVGVYRDKVIEAKYHSCCGGLTMSGDAPYLRAQSDTPKHRKNAKPFCSQSPDFVWRKGFNQATFIGALTKIIPNLNPKAKLRSIKLEKDRHTQRNRFVTISANRARYKIKSEELRGALDLKSNFYSVKMTRRTITITGHGYGHGVGLCQCGTREMASRGYSAEEILKHYYSGIKLKKIY
jgi:stage II sporulation protein D (peptidoglycan lytic transglycosylase)